jgi:Trk-type K+ transport system membrane component
MWRKWPTFVFGGSKMPLTFNRWVGRNGGFTIALCWASDQHADGRIAPEIIASMDGRV